LSIVIISTTNIEMNLVTFKPSFNLLIAIIVISHLKELFQCFFGVVHKLQKCKQTFKFSYLSLVNLDLEYESIMQIGFPYVFPLPSWPKIPIGKHLLIEIEKQTTFHFSSVSCHFQKT
jgi:hypothetical protein